MTGRIFIHLLILVCVLVFANMVRFPVVLIAAGLFLILLAVYIGTYITFIQKARIMKKEKRDWIFGIFNQEREMRVYPYGQGVPIWFTIRI